MINNITDSDYFSDDNCNIDDEFCNTPKIHNLNKSCELKNVLNTTKSNSGVNLLNSPKSEDWKTSTFGQSESD